MFPRVGPTELIILLVIVLLIFGPGRIARIAGELGKGIRSFKEGVNSEDESDESEQDDETESNEN